MAHSELPEVPQPCGDPPVGFQTRICAFGTPVLGPPSPPLLSSHPAFYVGISLAGLLTLGAVLTATATVREAGGLMAVVSSLCPSPLGPPG